MNGNGYSVGQVADLAQISVRTLHHYDEIGLLRPTARTAAGHRRYTADDLARLREILVYRELEFGLDEIAAMLADPGRGTDDHLRAQHRLLRERITRSQQLLAAIEKQLEARSMGMSLTPEEQFEVFGTDKVGGEWADEARERWGQTDAYRESRRRTASYTKEDWQQLKDESDAALREWRDAKEAGEPADGESARNLAEAHRRFIADRFYDCDHTFHRNLAENYISDERFAKTFDDVAPGLARYVHDAIVANAEAHGA